MLAAISYCVRGIRIRAPKHVLFYKKKTFKRDFGTPPTLCCKQINKIKN